MGMDHVWSDRAQAKFRQQSEAKMRRDHQWQDARYTAEQRAYELGEYDGYWRAPYRTGKMANKCWQAYFRGYLAGTIERAEEPSDEDLQEWMRSLVDGIGDGER